MPAPLNRAKITHREYDAIAARLRQGHDIEAVAADFTRGVNTIRVIRGRLGLGQRGRG